MAMLILLSTEAIAAKPFCALRDPLREIYQMYPEATAYRSEVHDIDAAVRNAVSDRLPFTLHLRELGQHTVYVPLRGDDEIGIVHARSESSEWGLIEIAWSLDMALTVADFRFQRCRGRGCDYLASEAFKARLRGRRVDELAAMLSADGKTLAVELPEIDESNVRLAATVLRSAMKTIVVTDILRSDPPETGPGD